ncbi:MAG TPA: hypothetical protein VFY95_04880 [Sphingomicrobium sp.]
MENDAVYFSRRAEEERAAALQAANATARQAHLDMADRYDDLAAAIAPIRSRAGTDPIGAV